MFKRSAFLFFVISMASMPAFAKTYYIASSGNDSNDGLTKKSPWQTITKVNNTMSTFRAGDSILFRRGDIFYGTLNLTTSGTADHHLVFSNFGKGEQPIITATIIVKHWSYFKDNIWKAHLDDPVDKFVCQNVFKNGSQLTEGRWPNANTMNGGYCSISETSEKDQITDSLLSNSEIWSGAEIVIRYNHWTLAPSIITGTEPHKFRFLNRSGYLPAKGWGYFIQNHLTTLDSEGEWFYDLKTNNLYLYARKDPSASKIEVPALANLIMLSTGLAHVTIENLKLKGGFSDVIIGKGQKDDRIDDIIINHCQILYSGKNGINLSYIKNSNLINNYIYGCHESGINLTAVCRISIKSNRIVATSLTPGFAGIQGASIKLNTKANDSVTIAYNYCDSTGYGHVLFGGSHLLIKNNLFKNYCMLTDDGAAVYCFKNALPGNAITQNIILDGHSSPHGVPEKNRVDAPVAGVYLDDSTRYARVLLNTIARTGIGIMLNNTSNDTITYNKIFATESAIRYNRWKLGDGWAAMRNLVVKQNTLFATNITDTLIRCWDKDENEIKGYGTGIDSNYFIVPKKVVSYIAVKENNISKEYLGYSLNDWQQKYRHDLHSTCHTYHYQDVSPSIGNTSLFFEYNLQNRPRKIALPYGLFSDFKGRIIKKTAQIEPYGSLMLYRINPREF